jgi:hypothetical protein
VTIREYLTRRVRWSMAVAISGWVLFAFSMGSFGGFRTGDINAGTVLQILGFLMFGGAALALARTKCPKCSATLGQTGTSLAIPFLKQPNFCTYCGVSFDQPMPGKPAASINPQDPIR